MKKYPKKAMAVAGLGLFLAACDGGGTSTPPPVVVPPPIRSVQDSFGSVFSAAFVASPNSDPVDTTPDMPPVSFTTDPIDF